MALRGRTIGGYALVVIAVFAAVVLAQNVLLSAAFPQLVRLPGDVSPAYLLHRIRAPGFADETIFFGDSVLWGFRVAPEQTAVALLRRRGCACENLALKAGGPASDYALALVMARSGVRPARVVIEINQKAFNALDPSYGTLHPALAALAGPLLSDADRKRLKLPPSAKGPGASIDVVLADVSRFYAMRADIRELLFGVDEAEVPPPPTDFFGMYDVRPLREGNLGVVYLRKTLALLHTRGVPVVAFLTPTNHPLLHDYIDGPDYARNGAYLRSLLRAQGATVLDLDRALPQRDFLDNAHLTPEGQQRLAAILAHALGVPTPEPERTRS